MKISNKERVVHFNLLILSCIAIIVLLYIFRNILAVFVDGSVLEFFFAAMAAVALIFLFVFVKNQRVFEFENNGELISIKSYNWFWAWRKMIFAPVFEMPKDKILKISMTHIFIRRYLNVYFSGNSGIQKKIVIDITGCSKQNIKDLFGNKNNIMK